MPKSKYKVGDIIEGSIDYAISHSFYLLLEYHNERTWKYMVISTPENQKKYIFTINYFPFDTDRFTLYKNIK